MLWLQNMDKGKEMAKEPLSHCRVEATSTRTKNTTSRRVDEEREKTTNMQHRLSTFTKDKFRDSSLSMKEKVSDWVEAHTTLCTVVVAGMYVPVVQQD